MPKFRIAIDETVTATFEVEAATEEEAERIMNEEWMEQVNFGKMRDPLDLSCVRDVYAVESG